MFSRLSSSKPRTIARDLSWAIAGAVFALMALLGGLNYQFAARAEEDALRLKADDLSTKLADVLKEPLWNLDPVGIKRALDVFVQSDIVAGLSVRDDQGTVYNSQKGIYPKTVQSETRSIRGNDMTLGTVTIAFDLSAAESRQRSLLLFHVLITISVFGAILVTTRMFVRRFLNKPMLSLKDGLNRIAGGEYAHRLPAPPQHDVAAIVESVHVMADQIAIRELLVRDRACLETELQLAQSIQHAMMLQNTPAGLAWHYEPVSRLSGDWFTCISDTSGDNLYLVIGDVTGHGVPQGLVTTAVKGALETLSQVIAYSPNHGFHHPGNILALLDDVVRSVASSNALFMTALAAKIHIPTGTMEVANAGHPFPYVIRTDEHGHSTVRQLVSRPLPLLGQGRVNQGGFAPGNFQCQLRPDETLALYTDGLTEARSQAGIPFGRILPRSLRAMLISPDPEIFKQQILELHRQHCAGNPLRDDVCLMLLAPHDGIAA